MVDHHYSSVASEMTLAAGIDSSAGSMSLSGVSGLPPTTPYTLVIDPDEPTEEIVTVTARSGSTFTIERAQEGTPALPHSSNAVVRHKATARDLRWSREHEQASSNVHGLTSGNVVGTSQPQTLTNKDIDGGLNNFTNIPQASVTGLPELQNYVDSFHEYVGYRVMTKSTGNYFGGGDFVRVSAWEDASLSPGSDGGILYGVEDSGALSVQNAGRGIYSVHAHITAEIESGESGVASLLIYRSVTSGLPFVLARGREYQPGGTGFYVNVSAFVPAVELDVGQYVYCELAHTFGGGLNIGNVGYLGATRFELTKIRSLP